MESNNFNFTDYLESRNWGVTVFEDGNINVAWSTPYGGDFNFDLDGESPISDFMFQAEGFDVDEYVKLWLGGRGAPTAKELVEDGEAIQNELNEICAELSK